MGISPRIWRYVFWDVASSGVWKGVSLVRGNVLSNDFNSVKVVTWALEKKPVSAGNQNAGSTQSRGPHVASARNDIQVGST